MPHSVLLQKGYKAWLHTGWCTDIHSPLWEENKGNGQRWCGEGGSDLQHWKHLMQNERLEDGIQHPWSLSSSSFREEGRHWLVWPLREGWVSQGEKEGQKRFYFSLTHLKLCLIPLLLPSTLNTEMKSLRGAKRWQSIPGIWLQQGNTQYWDTVLTLERFSGPFCWKM